MTNTISIEKGGFEYFRKMLNVNNPQSIGRLIGRVLHPIRDSLTYVQSAELISLLPDYLKIVYVSNWKSRTKRKEINHLDELVEEVKLYDKKHEKSMLSDEFVALTVVVETLRMLHRHINFLDYDYVKYSLKEELKQALRPAA